MPGKAGMTVIVVGCVVCGAALALLAALADGRWPSQAEAS
jgi:hypothetical protein